MTSEISVFKNLAATGRGGENAPSRFGHLAWPGEVPVTSEASRSTPWAREAYSVDAITSSRHVLGA